VLLFISTILFLAHVELEELIYCPQDCGGQLLEQHKGGEALKEARETGDLRQSYWTQKS
jgi:hypothetical protein